MEALGARSSSTQPGDVAASVAEAVASVLTGTEDRVRFEGFHRTFWTDSDPKPLYAATLRLGWISHTIEITCDPATTPRHKMQEAIYAALRAGLERLRVRHIESSFVDSILRAPYTPTDGACR